MIANSAMISHRTAFLRASTRFQVGAVFACASPHWRALNASPLLATSVVGRLCPLRHSTPAGLFCEHVSGTSEIAAGAATAVTKCTAAILTIRHVGIRIGSCSSVVVVGVSTGAFGVSYCS